MKRENLARMPNRKVAVCLLVVLALMLGARLLLAADSITKVLDVPYIHQGYDTPDDFYGNWACAPACAVMVLAYYDRIAPNPIHVSWPAPGHQSDYGVYISREYTYGEHTFSHTSTLETASGYTIAGKGAWGHIWKDGIDHVIDNLIDYLKCHDLVASFEHYDERSARRLVQEEIDLGRPLIARNLLDPSGHYVVVVGYKIDEHGGFWYLANDPLGKAPYEALEYGIDQPVAYSYSQLGLGEYRSRGLMTIKP